MTFDDWAPNEKNSSDSIQLVSQSEPAVTVHYRE